MTAPDYHFANPLFPPTRHPPQRAPFTPGTAAIRVANGAIDIGAYEQIDLAILFGDGFEE